MPHFRLIGCVSLIVLLSGCGAIQPNCRIGEQLNSVETLYFGSGQQTGQTGLDQWQNFVAQVVTPAFPKGLTWWEANGQWRTATGRIGLEAAKVLQIVHPDLPKDDQSVLAIIEQYKLRFQQESVLRVHHSVCTSF
jgi:hypothetical protein